MTHAALDLKLPRPGFWVAVALSFMVVLIQTLLSVPLAFIDEFFVRALDLPAPRLPQNPLMAGAINIVAFGGAIAVGLLINRLSFRNAYPFRRFRLAQIASMAVMIFGGDILLSEADNVFRSFAPPPQFLLDAFKEIFSNRGNLAARIFLLVIVAPVTEELLFRGLILRGLLGRFRPAPALLLSSFLFAAVHMNPWQFLSAFCLGVGFGWVYLRTGSIALSVLAHAFSNGLFVLFTSLPGQVPGLTGEVDFSKVTFQPWWLDLAGLVLLVAGVVGFRLASRFDLQPAPAEELFDTPPAAPL